MASERPALPAVAGCPARRGGTPARLGGAARLLPPSRAQSPLPRPAPAGPIGLGTCVLVSLSGRGAKTEEGVVIELVAPGEPVRSARVACVTGEPSEAPCYVVQCWTRRVLRHAGELIVVVP